MRVAIYARFSSDLQDVRFIADQIGAARDHAMRQGWATRLPSTPTPPNGIGRRWLMFMQL
jgi:hypothetical protein